MSTPTIQIYCIPWNMCVRVDLCKISIVTVLKLEVSNLRYGHPFKHCAYAENYARINTYM